MKSMRHSISIVSTGRKTMITGWNLSGKMTCRIWYVYSGSGTYVWNGKTYTLRQKHLYFFPPNAKFKAESNYDFPIDHIYFDFFTAPPMPDWLEPKAIKIDDEAESWQMSAINMMNYAVSEIKPIAPALKANSESASLRLLNETVSAIFQWAVCAIIPDYCNDEMFTAAKYINDNYKENIIISELAKSYGLTTDYFIRRFKSTFGTTPYSYLLSLRKDVAQILRKDKSIPLEAVAKETGFSSASAMLHALKKEK